MAKAKKKKRKGRRTARATPKPRASAGCTKGATNIADNPDLVEHAAHYLRMGRTRWEVKKHIDLWVKENQPERKPVAKTTREKIMRNAEVVVQAWRDEYNANLLESCTNKVQEWIHDPDFNDNARVRCTENIIEWNGAGAKHGASTNDNSPEAKAARARRALQEADATIKTEGVSK